ncbi:hypothetical protein HU200_060430 [Digitaria exilis]|uniref:Uncharacterized protein n=1 Tax=Digitaria exilis TaxID=1010633 RepID=A0A835AGK5_9POAL|nr:hypothetical protein HU200_060430 [Digitaria exilis]
MFLSQVRMEYNHINRWGYLPPWFL